MGSKRYREEVSQEAGAGGIRRKGSETKEKTRERGEFA